MINRRYRLFVPASILLIAALACGFLPGGGSTSGIQATANAALTQAASGVATAGAQGSSLQATANAASTQALATANAAGASQATAAPTTTATAPAATTAGGNASASPKGIPLIDPHTVITDNPVDFKYTTTADVQTVARFYQDQMPKLGWAEFSTAYVSATHATLTYKKASNIANLVVSVDPTTKQTVVLIIIE